MHRLTPLETLQMLGQAPPLPGSLEARVSVCRTCEQHAPEPPPTGRCEWIAEETGRPCANCYLEHLAAGCYPPADVCKLNREDA